MSTYIYTDDGTDSIDSGAPTGKLGIGSSDPDSVLEICGDSADLSIRQGDDKYSVKLGSNADGKGFLLLFDDNPDAEVSDAKIELHAQSGVDCWINNGGNVGIGTTNPGVKLVVSGNSASTIQHTVSNTDTESCTRLALSQIAAGDTYNFSITRYGSNHASKPNAVEIINAMNSFMSLGTAGTEAIRIASNRDVGIGTTSPDADLDVAGDVQVDDDLNVDGTFTCPDKQFRIDHPIKKNMYLVHGCIEGPECGVMYRGSAQLKNGKAIIKLPKYFEGLTKKEKRTIQLTCIDGWSPIFVEGEIKKGQFVVKLHSTEGSKNQKFNWLVNAVRNDSYLRAKKNKTTDKDGNLIVEVKKTKKATSSSQK